MKSSHLIAALFTLSGLSTAWPWPPSVPDLSGLSGLGLGIERRIPQDGNNNNNNKNNNNNNNNNNAKATPAASANTAKQTGGSSSKNNGPSKTSSNKQTSVEKIPATAAPGIVQMIEPPLTSGSQYYRVDTTVTWVWNYTQLLRTPAHINIVATVSETSLGVAPSPFTLAVNQTFQKTQTFTWDTGEYYTKTSRLPVGIYTLQVYDADIEGGFTAIPKPGYLAPFAGFYFGMYTPTPFASPNPAYQCITCNAAGGKMAGLTVGFLFGTAGITMGTFVYFAIANGVL